MDAHMDPLSIFTLRRYQPLALALSDPDLSGDTPHPYVQALPLRYQSQALQVIMIRCSNTGCILLTVELNNGGHDKSHIQCINTSDLFVSGGAE